MSQPTSIPRYRPKGLRTRLFYARARRRLQRKLLEALRPEDGRVHLHGSASHDEYEGYGDREIRSFETDRCKALVDGALVRIPYADVRASYLVPAIDAAKALREGLDRPVRVLEVGCGNGTNLMLLREALGGDAELKGIDISPSRLEVGRTYWGERLAGVELVAASATDLSCFEDGQFDLVYSVCALEQITYDLHAAVAEMARLCAGKVVCVEPLPELGTTVQRLYNVYADQCRTLLPEFSRCGLEVERLELIPVLHNPLSPVGLLVGSAPASGV